MGKKDKTDKAVDAAADALMVKAMQDAFAVTEDVYRRILLALRERIDERLENITHQTEVSDLPKPHRTEV